MKDEDFVMGEDDDGGSPTDDSGGDDSDASEGGVGEIKEVNFCRIHSNSFSSSICFSYLPVIDLL